MKLVRVAGSGLLGVLGALVCAACSLTVDLDELENGRCPSGQKLCDSECVSVADPAFGCGNESCAPCNLQYATARCSGQRCEIAACRGNRRDCDMMPANGCEVDIDHDPQRCGSCTAAPCRVENGTPDCSSGRCALRSCDPNFWDCNDSLLDGCEAREPCAP